MLRALPMFKIGRHSPQRRVPVSTEKRKDLSLMRACAVLDQIDALPGSKLKFAINDGDL